MKHYVAIIKDDSRDLFEFEDRASAMERFHQEMAYAYNQKATTLCVVLNANGGSMESEKYTAPPAPEPEADGGDDE